MILQINFNTPLLDSNIQNFEILGRNFLEKILDVSITILQINFNIPLLDPNIYRISKHYDKIF